MTGAPALASLLEWIVDGARTSNVPQVVFEEFCMRALDAGVAIDRVALFVETLHPSIIGRRFLWERDKGVAIAEARVASVGPEFRNNPVGLVYHTGQAYRNCICAPNSPRDFPIIDDLAADGFTDYVATPLAFTDGSTHAITWSTRRPGGFSQSDIEAFESLRRPLARLAEVYALKRVASNLLNTYVGERSGARILAGHIRRGDIEQIRAAVWLSDLRGSTELSETLSGRALVDLLNRHFDCLTPGIAAHGGEILKYMGDGILAIFPTSEVRSEAEAARDAHAAALEGRRLMAEFNEKRRSEGEAPLGYGLSLHIGEIQYGNIGGGDRLDFTAIGPAVNVAARLDGVAAESGHDIVASAAFLRAAELEGTSLGSYSIKGVRSPIEVYALL